MQQALTITQTTVGKKAIIAVTGVILFGFVIGHLAGNLLLFVGPEAYNEYAASLKSSAALLWGVRLTLLVSVTTHIALTMQLARRNAAARPQPYKNPRKDQLTTYAARTMVLSGPILALFILFHLAHFTAPGLDIGHTHSTTDVFSNVVGSFRIWWVSAIYIFANILLGLHLFHGGWSALQSVGASHPRFDPWRKRLAILFAVFVAGGNCFIPVAVMINLIGE